MSRGRPSLANMQTCLRSRLSKRTDLDMDDRDLLFFNTDFVDCAAPAGVIEPGGIPPYGDVLGSVSLDEERGVER